MFDLHTRRPPPHTDTYKHRFYKMFVQMIAKLAPGNILAFLSSIFFL